MYSVGQRFYIDMVISTLAIAMLIKNLCNLTLKVFSYSINIFIHYNKSSHALACFCTYVGSRNALPKRVILFLV